MTSHVEKAVSNTVVTGHRWTEPDWTSRQAFDQAIVNVGAYSNGSLISGVTVSRHVPEADEPYTSVFDVAVDWVDRSPSWGSESSSTPIGVLDGHAVVELVEGKSCTEVVASFGRTPERPDALTEWVLIYHNEWSPGYLKVFDEAPLEFLTITVIRDRQPEEVAASPAGQSAFPSVRVASLGDYVEDPDYSRMFSTFEPERSSIDWMEILRPVLVGATNGFGIARSGFIAMPTDISKSAIRVAGHIGLCPRADEDMVTGDPRSFTDGRYADEPFVNQWYAGPCTVSTSLIEPSCAADLLNRVYEGIEGVDETCLLGAQAVLLESDPHPVYVSKTFVLPPLPNAPDSPS